MAIYRATLTGFHYNQITCQNVLAFEFPDTGDAELPIAAELRDGWCTILATGQVSQFGWRNISVREVGTNKAPINLPVVVNGADLSDASAAVPAVTVKWRLHTPVAGRRGRGRVYVPGFRQAYWNGGQLSATGVTNITTRLNQISARYVGVGATAPIHLGILPRGNDPTGFISVDFITLSPTPGIQRRRNLGVGI